ncbi:MAG: type II secretion system protein GspN [Myxococcaceae bacterium]|nr:type II secretion system protein GspN [Myxococcaceae bacterium]
MASAILDKLVRYKRPAGYAAFALFSFILFLFLTFPFDVVERQVKSAAEDAGFVVDIGSMGPGFFGITARKVKLMRKPAAGDVPDVTQALLLDSVSARPSLFPLGVALSADTLGGTVRANVGLVGNHSVRVTLDELDPKGLQGFTGIDMDGRLSGRLTLDIPVTTPPGSKTSAPDLGAANGLLSLDISGLQVNGGTLRGDFPLELPKAALGDIDARLKIEKGTGTVEALEGNGADLQLGGEGTITLARQLENSQLNLTVRLKASPEFTRSAGLMGSGISLLPPDKKDPTFRAARVAGSFRRPAFLPAR